MVGSLFIHSASAPWKGTSASLPTFSKGLVNPDDDGLDNYDFAVVSLDDAPVPTSAGWSLTTPHRLDRAREADLLRFQLDELDAADLDDPDEESLIVTLPPIESFSTWTVPDNVLGDWLIVTLPPIESFST